MKHIVRFLLLAVCAIAPQFTFAQTISESEAMANAQKVLSLSDSKFKADGSRRVASNRTLQELTLAYTAKKGTETYYYVFNIGNDDGFIIAGGDAIAHEILAYIPQGHFCYDSIPDNAKWWLGEYENNISTAKKFAPQKQQRSAPRRAKASVRDLFTDIPDLITTKWDQGYPYNAAIPEIQHTDGSSIVSPTGCVNTAVAQIMNYWQWPITGEGSYSYTLDYGGLDEWSASVAEGSYDGLLPATFSADFGNTTYDWDNMLDDYTVGTPTQAQIDAVSTLMYYVGVSEQTLYGPGGSGGGIDRMMKALKDNFRYSNRMSYLQRGDYLDDEWEEIIYSELSAGRPVCYESNLHAFIIHGYSSDLSMFSVNWGWGGFMDGYWKITGTDTEYFVNTENYIEDLVNHSILIHIEPNNVVHTNTFSEVGDTIIVDGIRYDLIGPLSKTVEVTYAMSSEPIYIGELVIPDYIVYNGAKYFVTKIGRYALSDNMAWFSEGNFVPKSKISSLQLPNNLRSIAKCGLANTSISQLNLPASVQMLGKYSLRGLLSSFTSITLPNQLPSIPYGCFMGNNELRRLSLPASVKAIGEESFDYCRSLSLLVVKSSDVPSVALSSSGGHPFVGCDISHEGKVLAVPRNSLEDYKNDPIFGLWHTIIPIDSLPGYGECILVADNVVYKVGFDDLTAVGYNGEGYDVDLVIPSSVNYKDNIYPVTSIQRAAFEDKCFKSLRIEEGIQEIGDNAFRSNRSLTDIFLPSTLQTIGSDAFRYCTTIESISVDERNTVFDSRNNCNALIETASNTLICGSLNTIIPHTVTTIAHGAFSNLYHQGVISINIPNSVTTIGDSAFCDCSSVKSIRIPNSASFIGSLSFASCYTLSDVYCYATSIPSSYDSTTIFDHVNLNNVTLYVPAGSIDAYSSTSPWSDFGTIIPIIPIESIQLKDVTLEQFSQKAIVMQTLPANATEGQIFYSSNNPKVATISPEGVITAVGIGTAIITAETSDGQSATCIVTVMPKFHKITYVLDGETYQNVNIAVGEAITLPEMPAKEGYTFSGWKGLPKDSIMPDYDLTVTGSYKINTYSVKFIVDGNEYQTISVQYQGTIVLPNPEKEGYTFSGWEGYPEDLTMPAHDVEISGTFTANYYTLRFTIDGEEYEVSSVQYQSAIVLPEPSKEGYAFSGWNNLPDNLVMPSHDVEITGSFKLRRYAVNYYVDGKYYMTISVAYGEPIVLPEEPVKEGFRFLGWEGYPEDLVMPAHSINITGKFEETTGFEGIHNDAARNNIYQLDGIKKLNVEKGMINIVDGKKVLVK